VCTCVCGVCVCVCVYVFTCVCSEYVKVYCKGVEHEFLSGGGVCVGGGEGLEEA